SNQAGYTTSVGSEFMCAVETISLGTNKFEPIRRFYTVERQDRAVQWQPKRRMNMQNLNGKRVIITGGSQGLGLAMVEALAACGANVIAISRDRANLSSAEHAGAAVIAGDATDATLMNKVVREEAPDVLILNAGARLPIKPIDQQSWDEFSTVWNTDVKAGLVGIQAALHTPMKRGGRVLVMSS